MPTDKVTIVITPDEFEAILNWHDYGEAQAEASGHSEVVLAHQVRKRQLIERWLGAGGEAFWMEKIKK